ncbi:9044_t:CDS:2 [Rhizophagus irregularis]|nr:9044_t:CDS:2 [Rhizophagus irregularis]
MSSRGDSGYMSNYSSIYSQKSDNFEDYYEDDYIDYNDTRNSLPTFNNNRKYESSEYSHSRRTSDANYLYTPPSPNLQQYSTSPNSSQKYIQNEFSTPESSRRDLSPNSQNRKPSLPSSPRNGLPINSPVIPNMINPPPRDDSSKNTNRSYTVGPNPRQYTSLPMSPKIHAETSRILIDNNYNERPDNDQIANTHEFETIPTSAVAANRKREAAVNEILTTELTYVDGLRKLVRIYLLPMRQRSANKILSKPIATIEEISTIFGNVEQLLKLHEQLLKSLEERKINWSPTRHISDIFLKNAPYLKMYAIYFKSFPQAIATMERLSKESKEFKKFLQQCQQNPELGGLPFNSFLSLPIQRIPRYKLLLEALLKYTEESDPDYNNLKKCVNQISAIADEVNEKIRDAENQQKVLEIQGQVTGLPNNIVHPARRFIYKGNLYKVSPTKVNSYASLQDVRVHFLFNDLLIFCLDFQGIYHYKGEIDLRYASVKDTYEDSELPYCFQIKTKNGTHTVRAKNREEKTEWIARLNETIWSLQNVQNGRGKLLCGRLYRHSFFWVKKFDF